MLPPDGPFLAPALALLALPFRPVTAGVLLPVPSRKVGVCIMPGAHELPRSKLRGIKKQIQIYEASFGELDP